MKVEISLDFELLARAMKAETEAALLRAALDAETAPDFEALRAIRNATVQELHQKMADEWGVPLQSLRSNFNSGACYCACITGGPCEHKWDGEGWESEDGLAFSATCSRCGGTAMSHDMRVLP